MIAKLKKDVLKQEPTKYLNIVDIKKYTYHSKVRTKNAHVNKYNTL